MYISKSKFVNKSHFRFPSETNTSKTWTQTEKNSQGIYTFVRSCVTCLHDLVCNLICIALYLFFCSVVSSLWQKDKEVNDKKEEKKAKAKAEESKEENNSENGETKTNEVYMYSIYTTVYLNTQ